jgi:benzoyl-CoA reductase/2-hydroxyglutaryl-CoA dehydratase subunit BcrC/BadD/HgdB
VFTLYQQLLPIPERNLEMNGVLKKLIELKGQGRRMVGCFPLYPPLPLLHSFGLTPITLWGLDSEIADLSRSDRHLQNYTCRVGRQLLEFVLENGSGLFDAFFMYNACDTLRNLPEILQEGLKQGGLELPVFRLHVPALSPDRTGVRAFLADKITSLTDELERFTGRSFSPSAFRQAVDLYREQRELCLELEDWMRQGRISFASCAESLCWTHFLPVEEHTGMLEKALLKAHESAPDERPHAPVMLSGILPPPAALMEAMDRAGLRVVANDIALFRRSYGTPLPQALDPAEFHCEFYFRHYPCSTMLPEGDRRTGLILDAVEESGARGFIFLGEKFCEYEYFEIPYLENRLREAGVNTLSLDMGTDGGESLGALRNRIEAFAELLLAGA